MNLHKGDIVELFSREGAVVPGKVVGFIFCPPENFTTVVVESETFIYPYIKDKYKFFSKDVRRRARRIWVDPKGLRVIRSDRIAYK